MPDEAMRLRMIEDYILELLAAEDDLNPAQLREDLTTRGVEMPFDSVRLVAVMAQVEDRYTVRLRADLPTARDMRSIRSFAERVRDAIDAAGSHIPHTATPP